MRDDGHFGHIFGGLVYSFYELPFEPRNFINTDMVVLRFKDAFLEKKEKKVIPD